MICDTGIGVFLVKKKQKGLMHNKKLEDYKLTASIHTVSIKSDDREIGKVPKELEHLVTFNASKNNRPCELRINPNKLLGDVFDYGNFITTIDTVTATIGLNNWWFVRIDLRLDNYDPEHYQRFAKLNRYAISAIGCTYKFKNVYETHDLFSRQQLSVAIKNEDMELENYDKNAESNGTDEAKSRLEERSKRLKGKDPQKVFCEDWFTRWDRALENLDLVGKKYNDELEKIYWSGKDTYPKRFTTLSQFLMEYSDCIFSQEQMLDLLSRLSSEISGNEKTKVKNKVLNFKKRFGIEYFSHSDMQYAVAEIKRATLEFFKSQGEPKQEKIVIQ